MIAVVFYVKISLNNNNYNNNLHLASIKLLLNNLKANHKLNKLNLAK